MNELNVSSMPEDYWAWTDTGKLVPLGICDGFDEAYEREPPCTHWVFTRQGLEELYEEIKRELGK